MYDNYHSGRMKDPNWWLVVLISIIVITIISYFNQ
jgi:hypothetical protein